MLSEAVSAHLLAAATQYRGAFECWHAFHNRLGHRSSEIARKMGPCRAAGAAMVYTWLAHQKAILSEAEQALALVA